MLGLSPISGRFILAGTKEGRWSGGRGHYLNCHAELVGGVLELLRPTDRTRQTT